jgi:site-specific recombinase XerD
MDLDVIRAEYLKYSKHFKSEATYRRYDTPHLNLIIDFMIDNGYTDSDDLDFDAIYDFIDFSKTKNNSNKTINKRIQILNRSITHMIKQGIASPTIISAFPKLKENDIRFETVDEDTMIKVIKYLLSLPGTPRTNRNRAIVFTFIDTGARLSEVTNIETKCIDFNTNSVLLKHTKTKKERIVYFSDFTAKHLLKYKNQVDDCYKALFRNSKNNEPMNYLGVLRIFQKIKKDLNLAAFSSHMIRHSYCTLGYEKGVNEFFINRTAGHAKMDMTRRYTHMNVKTNARIYKEFAPMEHYVNKK